MKLDMDCVRSVLLACEECSADKFPLPIDELSILRKDLNVDILSLKYCVLKMSEGGLLEILALNSGSTLEPQMPFIISITWAGHQFLETVRDDRRWTATKKVISAVRNYSLEAISAVAKGITDSAISVALSQHASNLF